jgi:hypothetical protein
MQSKRVFPLFFLVGMHKLANAGHMEKLNTFDGGLHQQ